MYIPSIVAFKSDDVWNMACHWWHFHQKLFYSNRHESENLAKEKKKIIAPKTKAIIWPRKPQARDQQKNILSVNAEQNPKNGHATKDGYKNQIITLQLRNTFPIYLSMLIDKT